MWLRCYFFLALVFIALSSSGAQAIIHRAPIVVSASDLGGVAGYPVASYRLYRSDQNGLAQPIPFQIDEVNEIGDYVVNQGMRHNADTGNGFFQGRDELSFMGDDVGVLREPTRWPGNDRPQILYEISFKDTQAVSKSVASNDKGFANAGAVYLAVFLTKAPEIEEKSYVVFDMAENLVRTSRYNYYFDPQNYLVVDKIEMRGIQGRSDKTIIDSSTFFMQADLKYFVTAKANHRSIESRLDGYKTGPIRTIVRVAFYYSFLRLNFEVGMYTEVSFFANSVLLPAVMYIPIDGSRFFNKGSGFYYGFALRDSPNSYQLDTNLSSLETEQSDWFGFLGSKKQAEGDFWASVVGKDQMFYIRLNLSEQMLKDRNLPRYYQENLGGDALAKRDPDKILPLGQSPVNLALYFDLTRFKEGEHQIAFQLFFENQRDDRLQESYRHLDDWQQGLRRIF